MNTIGFPKKKKIKEKKCSRRKYINASNNISSYNIVHDSVIEVKFKSEMFGAFEQ